MMKVVLLNRNYPYYKLDSASSLTTGKVYNVIEPPKSLIDSKISVYHYLIENDYGIKSYFKKSFFKLLSEVRDDKINFLLDENSSMDEV